MGFQDSWWNISVSSLVIIAASVFEISCEKTDRHKRRWKTTLSTRLLSAWVKADKRMH